MVLLHQLLGNILLDGKEADVIADAQTVGLKLNRENVDTKSKKTTMSSVYNGGNIGVQFEISATFRGKTVASYCYG